MGEFLEALSGTLIERRMIAMLVPPLLFWGGGLWAYLSCSRWSLLCSPRWQLYCTPDSCSRWELLGQWLRALPDVGHWSLLIAGALLIVVSAVAAERLVLPALRLLEGYWPRRLGFLGRWLIKRQLARAESDRARLTDLEFKKSSTKLTPEEQREFAAKEYRNMRDPLPEMRMPTRLGNLLRAAETRPKEKYELNAIICWPRLWLVLPDGVKKELAEAHSGLDTAVRVWVWAIFFLVWVLWAWWALPVGLLTAHFAYRWSLSAAEVYADVLESAFDLHRWTLYEALHWPPPKNPAAEKESGKRLTKYLRAGSSETTPDFVTRESPSRLLAPPNSPGERAGGGPRGLPASASGDDRRI